MLARLRIPTEKSVECSPSQTKAPMRQTRRWSATPTATTLRSPKCTMPLRRVCLASCARPPAMTSLRRTWCNRRFLQMHRARGSFIPGAAVTPWAFAIAQRLLIDRARRRRLERRLFADLRPTTTDAIRTGSDGGRRRTPARAPPGAARSAATGRPPRDPAHRVSTPPAGRRESQRSGGVSWERR